MDSVMKKLRIPLADIKSGTDNFSESNFIGQSGIWKVYKGQLISQGGLMVASMRLNPYEYCRIWAEWKETMIVTQYKHENLVSLVGFCEEKGEKIVVYEYVSNKSLDEYVRSDLLSWNQRLSICIGAARGLNYIHNQSQTHGDIRSSNILLDQDWNPKIADLGISKVDYQITRLNFISTYTDPVHFATLEYTEGTDIYSFGVVLFELLCGRLADNHSPPLTAALVDSLYKENKLDTIVKTSIQDQISPLCFQTFSRIAYQCLRSEIEDRPSMATILQELEIALQYQEKYEKEESDSDDESDFWEAKLPSDWKGMVTKFNIPRAIYTIKRDLFSLLHKGIHFDEGNKFLWINNDGTKCVLTSAKRFIELDEGKDHRWVFQRASSRFSVVAEYLYGKWHKIRCQIKTSMLSLGTMYAANLVFKYSKKPNEGLKQSRLMTLRWKVEELSIYSTHYAELTQDDWYKIRMWNFVNQGPNADFDIEIAELSYYNNPVESGLLIQGIEFQPIEMPKEIERIKSLLTIDEEDIDDDLYWEKKLPNEYQQYIEISDESLHYTSKQELYFLLCTGFIAYGGKMFLSLCKSTGGICSILPAKHILCKDTSYESLQTLSLSKSRFGEVKELGSDDWYLFTCRLRPFMFSPTYIYACYLVFKFGDNPLQPNDLESSTSSTGLRGIRKSLGLPFKSTKQSGVRFQLRQKFKNKFGDNHVIAQFFKVEYKLGEIIQGSVIGHMNSTPPINIPTIKPKNGYGSYDDSSSTEASGMWPKGQMDVQNSWMEERNDGWMEVRLSKALHQLEKQVSLEVKLWKPEGGSFSGIIVEGIEFRPMQELSDLVP